jgi:restriction-modification enzyme MmeI-like protein/restriction endonuclease TaqI-like protein
MGIKQFFENIDFSFGSEKSDIKPVEITISENDELTQKLKDNIYAFDSPSQTNSSFYVITIHLEEKEFFELRRYVWNEDRYDLYFVADKYKSNIQAVLYYAKTNPRSDEVKIASFTGRDTKKLEKIKKWKFDSGAFWEEYGEIISKVRDKNKIDKKLVEQLRQLKNKLQEELNQQGQNNDKIVQALIDRTLFIKFLEDNHIINSFFYHYNFPKYSNNDCELGYKTFLKEYDVDSINKLFGEINKIFNNVLFETPSVKKKYLTDNVLDLIYEAIRQQNWHTGQMSLFDFRFDVIPIEFISHIYEVFLEEKQLENGIFYTPRNLAELIIDDTVTCTGTVLDPACGSGIFLVLALRRMLKNDPPKSDKVSDIIKYRNKLLKENIFGIEIKNIAWRLTIFSLYLEILKGIRAEDIKEYIKTKLESDCEFTLFPYDFSSNIIKGNALDMEENRSPHKGKLFKYILGNPPFFKINDKNAENDFISNYQTQINNETLKANVIVEHKQISQAFMIKIKDWASPETRFGFVLNSSNFYNDDSKFQSFFFEHYQIETFYELSHVKDILFRKASESVVVTIFNNKKIVENILRYYPVYMGTFSEVFDFLIIQEDNVIKIKQRDILTKKVILRDHLIGNKYDLKLLCKMSNNDKLESFLLKDKNSSSFKGAERATSETVRGKIKFSKAEFESLSKKEKVLEHEKFALKNYLSKTKTNYFNIPYIYQPGNKVIPFQILNIDGYMNITDLNKQNFQRPRNSFIYEGKNIIFNRFGERIESAFVNSTLVFSNLIYGIKLRNKNLYYLFTSILNSDLVNYYLLLKYRKRVDGNFSNLDTVAIKNIPVPSNLDEYLVSEISKLGQQLTEGELQYKGEIKKRLNTLIFDLYNLNFLERQRIKDFFETKNEIDLEKYKESLYQTIEIYFEKEPVIECYQNRSLGFNIIIAAIYFNYSQENMPSGEDVFRYSIRQIMKTEKFLAMREFILGENCIYIVRDNAFKNWTISKGFEDGKEILKRLGE